MTRKQHLLIVTRNCLNIGVVPFLCRCLRSVTKGHCIECLHFFLRSFIIERDACKAKNHSLPWGEKNQRLAPQNPDSEIREFFAFGIRNPGFGIWNTAHGFWNHTNDWNPESKFHCQNWIPVPGIRNPRHGIQNPGLSWIPSHGATMLTDESLYGYFRQNRTTLTERRSEIFSNDQRWSHCHSGQGCQVSLVVQWEQRNSAKYHALWEFLVLLPKSIAFSVVVVVAPAPSSATAQNSTWYASHDFLEKTTTRWKTRAESDVRRYPYKDRLSSSALLLLELPIDCETVIRDFVQKSQKTCILLRNNEKLTLALKVPSQSKINFASYSLRR